MPSRKGLAAPRSGRPRAEALERLLAWQHSGFSVHVGEALEPAEKASLERLGRYVARAPIALSKVKPQEDGRVRLLTPPDPKTDKDSRIFDPLEWVHAVTTRIP